MNIFGRSTQLNHVEAASVGDLERDFKHLERSASLQSLQTWGSAGGGGGGGGADGGSGEDAKGAAAEFGSIWTRMPIEYHSDFPPEESCILIPFRDLPENWASAPDTASLNFLDRDFIFPGEQFHILVRATGADISVPDIVLPIQVATPSNQHSTLEENLDIISPKGTSDNKVKSTTTEPSSSLGQVPDLTKTLSTTQVPPSSELAFQESLFQEGHKKRSLALLENYRKSHYFVQLSREDEPILNKQTVSERGPSSHGVEAWSATLQNTSDLTGCSPVIIEGGKFNPHTAGGLARQAVACSVLGNGDIVVLLQVTMMVDNLPSNAFLEVLQFERFESPQTAPFPDRYVDINLKRHTWDPTQGLLQWLLPLDRPSSPPPYVGVANSPPPKIPTGGASNSTIFSFGGHLRSSSLGSIPGLSPQSLASSLPLPGTLAYGPKDSEILTPDRGARTEVGSEGLLSFRGAVLEPQRFSARCGLEGLHVPGKRWRKKVSIFQPIKVESYFTHCNTQDLICVLVENVLPVSSKTEEVVIFVDSVNIVCQSAAPGSPPLPVPIACVEVGECQQLPGIPLRVGEQHSFILRPTNPAWKPSVLDGAKYNLAGAFSGQETYFPSGAGILQKKGRKDLPSLPCDTGSYAIIVSCRCSHTGELLDGNELLDIVLEMGNLTWCFDFN